MNGMLRPISCTSFCNSRVRLAPMPSRLLDTRRAPSHSFGSTACVSGLRISPIVQGSLQASFYRGGTSKGLVILQDQLPKDRKDWAPILLRCMGSPDPHGRQLDGMGGGLSSLSKVCVVKPSEREDADVDFTFVQIGIRNDSVDFASNCGNMISAIGPFGVEQGLQYATTNDGHFIVRIHNTNTGKIIHSRFPRTSDGMPEERGDFAMDGVPGTAARIQLDFVDPSGSRTGKLLPTGNPIDTVSGILGDSPKETVQLSLIDCANPCVFVAAKAFGLSGLESPDELTNLPKVLANLETARRRGAVMMGMSESEEEAASTISVPKVCIVSSPTPSDLGQAKSTTDVVIRTISSGDSHRAIPITVSLCVAAAANIKGSLVNLAKTAESADPQGLVIAHPSGTIVVGSKHTIDSQGNIDVKSGTLYRTARKLFEGKVFY